jgi:predicted dehydrogenase
MSPLRVGVVGLGKIAIDQHLPAIEANPNFTLGATVSRSGAPTSINFTSHGDMLRGAKLDAVAITTPPGPRFEIARECIAAGLHVLLEKPPTATLAEIDYLERCAADRGVSLFTTWHAQHNAAVIASKRLLTGKRVRSMSIIWHEDVDKWHPGQKWIWQAGGFGVFDPGINAFSIVSLIFPASLFVREAALFYPAPSHTPIAAEIDFFSPDVSGPMHCSLDFRRTEGQQWTIAIETEDGTSIELRDGGSRLIVDGVEQASAGEAEYPDIYRRFAELVEQGASQGDTAPLRMVADCLLVGSREIVETSKAGF